MVYLIKLLIILSFGAFCALDAEAQEDGPTNPHRPKDATLSENAAGNQTNSQDSAEGTQEGAGGPDRGEVPKATAQPVVSEGPPSPLSENFAEYLRNLMEEINAKAAASTVAAAAAAATEEAEASILQEGEEQEVSPTEVVENNAEVVANTVSQSQEAETFAELRGGEGSTSTSTSTASPSTPSDASSPFKLITTLGLAVISAAATLSVAI